MQRTFFNFNDLFILHRPDAWAGNGLFDQGKVYGFYVRIGDMICISWTGIDGCTLVLKILAVAAMVLVFVGDEYVGNRQISQPPFGQIFFSNLSFIKVGAAVEEDNALAVLDSMNVRVTFIGEPTDQIEILYNLHESNLLVV